MLEMVKGCKVRDFNLLSEQFENKEWGFEANVNASKIKNLFCEFVSMQNLPMFFILELPASKVEEERLRKDETSPLHKNVYYVDGLYDDQALLLLNKFGELLINDGISNFGFGVHDSSAEIMLNKYNVVSLWTKDKDKYKNLFKQFDIPNVDKMVTAWDTFNEHNPGECFLLEVDGITAFDLINELEPWNIYLAEQREE